jgi:hypothetical protein
MFQPNLFFFLHPRIWHQVIYNSTKSDFPNLDVLHDLKKGCMGWLVKSHLWLKMKKIKIGIKQHAHVVNTMVPIPFMEVYDVETCM